MHHAIDSRVNYREARRCDVAPHVVLRARTAMLSLALLTFPVPAARGQAQGSFGLGVGTVRYAGGTKVSTASFSPAWTFDSPNTSLSFGGTLASVPLGVWSSQGRADVWVSTPPAFGGLHLGLQARRRERPKRTAVGQRQLTALPRSCGPDRRGALASALDRRPAGSPTHPSSWHFTRARGRGGRRARGATT